ncbi:MAG TPA: HEAT repeat domain-containing protein [Vicinamibacterales bacterium]
MIRASRAGEVDRLVADLRHGPAAARDAAIARLRVIGSRAVDKLAALLAVGQPPMVRAAVVRALEGIDDARVIDLALGALPDTDADVVTGAIGVLRAWIAREDGTRVMDALTAIAVDPARDGGARRAALDALSDLPRHLVQPVLQQAAAALGAATLDDPASAREWLDARHGAPLSDLHEFIVRARDAEKREPFAHRRQDWQVTRAAAHAVLAQRGSRVALYDLRETFDAAQGPLPLDFLTAVTMVGDASCLEPMARAWAAAPAGEAWWRERLADAAADIMHRTRLSGRSNVVKRIRAKWTRFL